MPPTKKLKTIGKSSSRPSTSRSRRQDSSPEDPIPFDRHLFCCSDAKDRFHTLLDSKRFIVDRYYPVQSTTFLYQKFLDRGWDRFMENQEMMFPTLIKEFYSNASWAKDDRFYVRGVHILISPQVIQDFFALPDCPNCKFLEFKANHNSVSRAVLARTLTIEGQGQWVDGALNKNQLTKEAIFWLNFIIFNIMPSSHGSNMDRTRALLTYCIMEGHPVDLASLIHSHMKTIARSTSKCLVFPHMLSTILTNSGVIFTSNEEQVSPLSGFTYESTRTPAFPRDLPPPPAPQPAVAPPQESFWARVFTELGRLSDSLQQLATSQEELRTQNNQILQYMQLLSDVLFPPPSKAPPIDPSTVILLPDH